MKEKSLIPAGISKMKIIMGLLYLQRLITAELITSPKDSEALNGTLTYFNCSSTQSSNSIHWFHYDIGTQQNRYIVYGYDQFHGAYQNRFRIERDETARKSNLVIERVSTADAGKFECQDDMGRGASGFAQLSVLEDNPGCDWKIENRQVSGGDNAKSAQLLHLNCTVDYRGNTPPAMIWKRLGSNEAITQGLTQIPVSSTQITYRLDMEAGHDVMGQLFQCESTRSVTTQIACHTGPVVIEANKDPSESSAANVTSIILFVILVVVAIVAVVFLGLWLHTRKKLGSGVDEENATPDTENEKKEETKKNVKEQKEEKKPPDNEATSVNATDETLDKEPTAKKKEKKKKRDEKDKKKNSQDNEVKAPPAKPTTGASDEFKPLLEEENGQKKDKEQNTPVHPPSATSRVTEETNKSLRSGALKKEEEKKEEERQDKILTIPHTQGKDEQKRIEKVLTDNCLDQSQNQQQELAVGRKDEPHAESLDEAPKSPIEEFDREFDFNKTRHMYASKTAGKPKNEKCHNQPRVSTTAAEPLSPSSLSTPLHPGFDGQTGSPTCNCDTCLLTVEPNEESPHADTMESGLPYSVAETRSLFGPKSKGNFAIPNSELHPSYNV